MAVVVDGGFVASFVRLVVAEQASVLRAARRVTGRRELAEDAVQEALLHALRQGPRVLAAREPGRVLRWLATRHACMELRARRRIDAAQAAHTNPADEASHPHPVDVVGPWESSAERADELNRVRLELARLPLELQDALRLRFVQGRTYQDIARALSISDATAHARVRRGLDALRSRLGSRSDALGGFGGFAALTRWLRGSIGETLFVRGGHSVFERLVAWLRRFGLASGVAGGLVLGVVALDRGASSSSSLESALAPTLDAQRPSSTPSRSIDSLASEVPTDLAELARRVPLSAYLDAGGSLPPFAPPSVTALPARLIGRVLDDRGQRLRDALVELEAAVPGVDLALSVARTSTDASGDFVLDDVPAATALTLRVRFANATIVLRPLELEPGASVALGTLVAGVPVDTTAGAFTVDLTVRDAGGNPVADAIVTLARRHLELNGSTAIARDDGGRTDRNGRILLDGRWLGHKRVELRHGGATLVHDISIESDGVHTFEWTAPAITPD
ncbi:MAG: sigma-70 family RNA polymerase sigma factor [Planctomycetes bacterium]|nr:sigma-70 family RNA polymerase sigma factor [Planctomycetota bacterium]